MIVLMKNNTNLKRKKNLGIFWHEKTINCCDKQGIDSTYRFEGSDASWCDLAWRRSQVPTRSMWIRSGANLLLGYSPALMKMQEMALRKRFAEAKELMDGRRWWDEHGLSWDGKRWDFGSGFRSREQARPRSKGINGEEAKGASSTVVLQWRL